MTRKTIYLGALALTIALGLGSTVGFHAAGAQAKPTTSAGSASYIVASLAPVGSTRVVGTAAFLTGVGGTGTTTPMTSTAKGAGTIVAIAVSGLQPSSKAVARVLHGACSAVTGSAASTSTSNNNSAYQSPTMLALPSGDSEVITTTTAMTSSVSTGWSIAVFGTSGAQAAATSAAGKKGGTVGSPATKSTTMAPVACGALHTPGMVIPLKPMMGQRVAGFAMITMSAPIFNPLSLTTRATPRTTNGAEVIVYASGLQPLVASPEHIHGGPCSTNAGVMFPLTDLLADAQGMAIQGTGLPITSALTGFSLHVHRDNFMPAACGDITSSSSSSGSSSTSGR